MSEKPAAPNPEDAFDKDKHDELAEAIKKLSPDEAAFFLWKLEISVRRRKVQLTGYLVAMVVWLVAMLGALVIYGSTSGFVGYVFLLPFAFVGVILWAFGKWSERIAKQQPPADLAVPATKAKPAAR